MHDEQGEHTTGSNVKVFTHSPKRMSNRQGLSQLCELNQSVKPSVERLQGTMTQNDPTAFVFLNSWFGSSASSCCWCECPYHYTAVFRTIVENNRVSSNLFSHQRCGCSAFIAEQSQAWMLLL